MGSTRTVYITEAVDLEGFAGLPQLHLGAWPESRRFLTDYALH